MGVHRAAAAGGDLLAATLGAHKARPYVDAATAGGPRRDLRRRLPNAIAIIEAWNSSMPDGNKEHGQRVGQSGQYAIAQTFRQYNKELGCYQLNRWYVAREDVKFALYCCLEVLMQ